MHLDVVGSDSVVTVDSALLASPERDRESRTQRLSTYLCTHFYRTPVPRVAFMQTPTRDEISEDFLQAQVAEPVQDEGPSHNTIERMVVVVEKVVGV